MSKLSRSEQAFLKRADEWFERGKGWTPAKARKTMSRERLESVLVSTEKTKGDAKYPYVSHALPKNLPGCAADKDGNPIIASRRHEQEVCRRWGLVRGLENHY